MLLSTASCSTNVTSSALLWPALLALNSPECLLGGSPGGGSSMSICLQYEYQCFADPLCRDCLESLFGDSSVSKAEALRSNACNNTSAANSAVWIFTAMGMLGDCIAFPYCTVAKQQCSQDPECTSCLATFMAGDGAAAAQQCPTYADAAINYVVNSCFADHAAACNYWRQRCSIFGNCDACLADIVRAGQDARAIAAVMSTENCQNAGNVPMNGMATSCPGVRMAPPPCTNRNVGVNIALTVLRSLVVQLIFVPTVVQ